MITENWGMLGHTWAVDMLQQHVANGTIRHAYLISGPPGLGRRTLALRLAQALNCTQPPAAGQPCGTCRDCRQIEAMQHPDLAVIQAESEGSVLKVDQVREVQHSLSLKPYQSKFRVALFLRFQEANDNAANALLKTLEEAPAHAVLLLTADSAEQLLPTITSRCEILRLRPLSTDQVAAYLQDHGANPDQARLLAHLSGGRPGYARRLLADPSLLEKRQEYLASLGTMLSASRAEKFAYAEKLARDKQALRQALLTWLAYWRDVMIRSAQAGIPIANADRADEIEALAGQVGLSQTRRLVQSLEGALARLEQNVNPRLLLEVLLLDLPKAA